MAIVDMTTRNEKNYNILYIVYYMKINPVSSFYRALHNGMYDQYNSTYHYGYSSTCRPPEQSRVWSVSANAAMTASSKPSSREVPLVTHDATSMNLETDGLGTYKPSFRIFA